ncbi:TniQ family protein [Streptomyces brevispora]|uniref:TniQ family protein n=1 Tax=Streptomyces brevispora TaxID=887462 RepID=UPI0035E2F320
MSPLRPLPSSLAPLQDESLAGFLLRLAHHNNVSPGTIIRHTGLSTHRAGLAEHLSISQQYLQAPEKSAEFARTTRLDEDEVVKLFLAPLGARYGPLDATLIRRPRERVLHGNHDVFRRWSRFCPRCLAGGSDIERVHGGSWKRLWRLPPVFACPAHRCLLRHNCAKCGHLGMEVQSFSLIPKIKNEDLHPNQCRVVVEGRPERLNAPICGARHDQAPVPACSEEFLETALALQRELIGLLRPDGPREVCSVGWMVDTNQYFIDLHTVAGLITLTWPAARNLALSAEHVEILDRDAVGREERRSRRNGGAGKFHHFYVLASPSADARPYIAATAIAHRILKGSDGGALTALASVYAHLQEVQGLMKTAGDRIRNSPRNSPPLRFLLTHRAPITIEGIHQYVTARDREWRPALRDREI